MKERGLRRLLPPLSFRARTFVALVGISAFTSLAIGLVLFYFAGNQLATAEEGLMEQRSRTAHDGAEDFLSGLRNPEDDTFPAPEAYAEELVRSIDRTGLSALYLSPEGEPLAARNGEESSLEPETAYDRLGLNEKTIQNAVQRGESGETGGRLIAREDWPRYIAVWPLTSSDGSVRGVMVYADPQAGFDEALTFLRYGILGAIGASVLLAGLASLVLARQITRPLSETRDAVIRVASGDYRAVPVDNRDELGELVSAFNYMAAEIEHYISEIQEQKSRLEAVLEASPEAVIAVDPDERITMSNPAAARMLGVRMSDVGRRIEELGVPEEVLKCLREASSTGAAVRELEAGEKVFWAYAAQMSPEADGVEFPGQDGRRGDQASPRPETDGLSPASREANGHGSEPPEHPDGQGGEPDSLEPAEPGRGRAGTILAVRDITEHRSLERAKTAFVSDVSHELRTPLTTIQSAVDLMGRGREKLDPIEHRALELAEGELGRVRGMVEELLTLAQMDSWQYALEMKPNDIDEVVKSAVDSVESKAGRFGIELHFSGHGDAPDEADEADEADEVNGTGSAEPGEHYCVCDAGKLYQVFLNLLDNAIKYSDPGAQVYVSLEEEGSSVLVRIRDTGVGIPEEDLPQLFERFYRVDKARSRATGGSGLGLSITRELVELHGGEVSVHSEVGVGSTFEVRLPKAPLSRSANYAI
ncbi:HAMP domain-containing histidine kinase [Rubrobacter aplysinae]|uniref:HAMP domain-containing histidine kinase n=1 Tax=Rubrobacter aplysinae TaxID=909625 RepID=UPI0006A00183|nr:HAMP domain-containing histidine kinase [Rubrobacter aplysinae]